MFGLGMGELLVILAIALIFLGPKRLPDLASTLGKAIRGFRKATSDLQDQLEVDESVKAPLRELKAALRDEPAPFTPPPPAKARLDQLQPNPLPPIAAAPGDVPPSPDAPAPPPTPDQPLPDSPAPVGPDKPAVAVAASNTTASSKV